MTKQETIPAKELANALAAVLPVIEARSPIRILSSCLFDGGQLTASDIENFISVPVGLQLRACPPAKKLHSLVSKLKGELAVKMLDTNEVELTAEGLKVRLLGFDPGDFPRRPDAPTTGWLKVPAADWRRLVEHTSFAIAKHEARYTIEAAQVEFHPGSVRMVTTDGHRLALEDATVEMDTEKNLLVKQKALELSTKLPGDTIEIAETEEHTFFRAGGCLLAAKRPGGVFPNYAPVLPVESAATFTVKVESLYRALKRIRPLADARFKEVTLAASGTLLWIEALSPEDAHGDCGHRRFRWRGAKGALQPQLPAGFPVARHRQGHGWPQRASHAVGLENRRLAVRGDADSRINGETPCERG